MASIGRPYRVGVEVGGIDGQPGVRAARQVVQPDIPKSRLWIGAVEGHGFTIGRNGRISRARLVVVRGRADGAGRLPGSIQPGKLRAGRGTRRVARSVSQYTAILRGRERTE